MSRSVSAVRASLSGFCRLYLKREPSNVESLNLPLPLAHTVLSYAAAEARLRRLPPMVLSPYECGSSRTPHTSRSVVGIHDALGISRNLELSKIARQAPEDELVLFRPCTARRPIHCPERDRGVAPSTGFSNRPRDRRRDPVPPCVHSCPAPLKSRFIPRRPYPGAFGPTPNELENE